MKYSQHTTAPKSKIWQIWTDVENWPEIDERLEYSRLHAPKDFEVGANGILKGRDAPATQFEVIAIDPQKSFTLSLKLPLFQTVELKRYFEPSENNHTVFTHEVNFKGGLRGIYYAILRKAFAKDLKLVVDQIKASAESKE